VFTGPAAEPARQGYLNRGLIVNNDLSGPAVLAAAVCLLLALPAAAAPAPVDTCALLPEAMAVATIGTLIGPRVQKPANGSMLGSCDYEGKQSSAASLAAYPADQLDGTVRRDVKNGRAQALTGLGEKAFQTPYGVMFQPPGKPWFLVVLVMRGAAYDAAASEKLARQLKL
jgi:hypothetical protein